MQARAGRAALLAALLSACGGNARISHADPATGGTSGASGSGVVEPSASGGTANGGTANGVIVIPVADNPSAGSGGSAGAPPLMHAALPCTNPVPRPHGGGYLQCSDGSLRRASSAACDSALPRPAADTPIVFDECTSDTDCTASAHGFCAYGACKYGCVTDAECASDQACYCEDFIGFCIPANCRSDADCPADFPCTAFQAPGFTAAGGLWCQSPEDECITDAQCNSLNPRVSCQEAEDVAHRICFLSPVG